MAPKPRTTKIPESSWARHKDKILEMFLLSERTLKEIADYMKTNHEFTATISQYEAQLRVWKARRRLTVQEWDSIFTRLNNVGPGTKSRVILSGRPVPEHHIRRARRHWKSTSTRLGRSFSDDRDTNSQSMSAYIEVQSPSGTWRQLAHSMRAASNPPPSQEPEAILSPRAFMHDSSHSIQHEQQIDTPPLLPIADVDADFTTWGEYTVIVDGMDMLRSPSITFSPSRDFTTPISPDQTLTLHTSPPTQASSHSCFSNYLRSEICPKPSASGAPFKWLGELSYRGLEYTLISEGIISTNPAMTWDETHFLPRNRDIAGQFQGIFRSPTPGLGQQARHHWRGALGTFCTLLPGNASQIVDGNNEGLIGADAILDSQFTRLLLFSMVNGLAGLEDAPMEGIIKFLARSQNIVGPFMQCLKNSGTYTARALAETLFGISVKTGENEVLAQLLKTGLVDVNSDNNSFDWSYKKAIEQASSQEDWKMAKLLLDANAHPTEKFIEHLEISHRRTVTTEWLRVWNAYWQQQPDVEARWSRTSLLNHEYVQDTASAIERQTWTRKAIQMYLSEIFQPAEHHILFAVRFIEHIPLDVRKKRGKRTCFWDTDMEDIPPNDTEEIRMRDMEATYHIGIILEACEQGNCGNCFKQHSAEVGKAAVNGAMHKYLNFVALLLPYCDDTWANIILSVSITRNEDKLASTALDQIEDFSFPSRHELEYELGIRPLPEEAARTPLAAAILARNETILHRLEMAGALNDKYLHQLHIFGDALHAAAEVQDIRYLKKLLSLHHSPVPSKAILTTLSYAIQKHYSDVAFEIMTVMGSDNLADHRKNLVTKAIRADRIDVSLTDTSDFLTLAASIGDIGYVRAHLTYRPSEHVIPLTEALRQATKNKHAEIALELINTPASVNFSFHREDQTKILTFAIKNRDVRLVRAILNADISLNGVDEDSFRQALIWGERPIIEDLISTFRTFPPGYSDESVTSSIPVAEMFETEDCDIIKRLLSQWTWTEEQLVGWLKVAILQGSNPKIQLFLDYYRDVSRRKLLERLARSDLDALHTVLMHLSTNPNEVILPFGAKALQEAITYWNQDRLDRLISSGKIDLEGKVQWHLSEGQPPWSHPDTTYLSPLAAAIYRGGDIGLIAATKLLNAGCSANTIVKSNRLSRDMIVSWTALSLAIQTKNEELVRLFIDRGADINQAAAFTVKRTPLQQAAEVGSLEIVKLLLKHGVDVNAAPSARSGGTALQFAAISGNCNIVAELLSHGALLYLPPSKVNGRWPIEGAAEHGRLTMIEYLRMAKKNTSFPDNAETGFEEEHYRRAMELAEKNGHFACKDFIADLWGRFG